MGREERFVTSVNRPTSVRSFPARPR